MIAFLAALPAFIQALPYIFQLAVKFMTLTEGFVSWSKRKNLLEWFEDVEKARDLLDHAQTSDDKKKAADTLRDLISKLK